jgi:hypothetical protein
VLSLLVRCGIKVPNVLACDTTRKNALNYPYLLQTRLPGTTLWKVWDDMSVDDRINIAGELAEILAKINSVRFPVTGRMLYDETSKTGKQSLDLAQISDIGEKLVVRGFHRFFEEHHERDAPTAPPTSSLYELLGMHIDARFQHKRADGHEIPGPELLKLQAMLQDMKDTGWFASDDGNAAYSIIDHAQLSPFGIMVEQSKNADGSLGWHISGVLQWEHARSIPPVLARRPPVWLFDVADGDSKPLHKRKFHRRSSLPQAVRRYQDGDSDMIPLEYYQDMNTDPTTAKIKERFGQVMAEKIYTPRYGARAMEVYQDDAYGKGRWLRRVWRLAKDVHFRKPRLEQVLKEWDEFKQTGQVSHETVFGDEDDSDSNDYNSTTSTDAYDHEPFKSFEHKIETFLQDLNIGHFGIDRIEDSGISAPRCLAFDISREKALGLPYSIQTRIPGVTWIKVIDNMPLDSQLLLAEDLAELMARLQTVQFDSSGRLMCNEKADTPLKLSLHTPIRAELKENLEAWGFPQGVGSLMDKERTAPAQPVWDSLYNLLFYTVHDLLTRELQKVEPSGPSEQLVRMYFKLQDMIQDMDRIGWFSEADKAQSKSVLHHWDLEARNILVQQVDGRRKNPWRITGVIDWDSPHALPPVLTMKPPIWLWDASDDAELPEDVQEYYDNDFDWMPLEYYQKENAEHFNADGVKVRQRFEEAIVKALYSEQYGEKAHAKYLDDAYGRGHWLRGIWRFASEGLSMYPTHYHRMQQLDREWTEYKKVNGIDYDHLEHAETLRVNSSMVWPNRAREGGQSEFKGIQHDVPAEIEQTAKSKTATDAKSNAEEGNTFHTIALDAPATEESTPQQHLPCSKTSSTFLHSFKCSPS